MGNLFIATLISFIGLAYMAELHTAQTVAWAIGVFGFTELWEIESLNFELYLI
jgi:hypothetical protein